MFRLPLDHRSDAASTGGTAVKPAHRGGSQAEQPASCPGQGSPRGQWGVAGHLRKGSVSGGSRNKASLHSSECRHLAAVFTRTLGLHIPDALRSQTEGADQVHLRGPAPGRRLRPPRAPTPPAARHRRRPSTGEERRVRLPCPSPQPLA